MTVKDLIKELKRLDPEGAVMVGSYDSDEGVTIECLEEVAVRPGSALMVGYGLHCHNTQYGLNAWGDRGLGRR